LGWIIKETQGSIGFEEQDKVLNIILKRIPENAKVVLWGIALWDTSLDRVVLSSEMGLSALT